MRKLILATAASAAMIAASLLPIGGAQAVTPGNASGVHAALAETNLSESVVLVCRRGYYGRRVCWDRPGYYGGGYGPGYYGGYPAYYGGYYGPGVGVYGPGVGIGIGIGPRWGW
jgi:hypothetical protein